MPTTITLSDDQVFDIRRMHREGPTAVPRVSADVAATLVLLIGSARLNADIDAAGDDGTSVVDIHKFPACRCRTTDGYHHPACPRFGHDASHAVSHEHGRGL